MYVLMQTLLDGSCLVLKASRDSMLAEHQPQVSGNIIETLTIGIGDNSVPGCWSVQTGGQLQWEASVQAGHGGELHLLQLGRPELGAGMSGVSDHCLLHSWYIWYDVRWATPTACWGTGARRLQGPGGPPSCPGAGRWGAGAVRSGWTMRAPLCRLSEVSIDNSNMLLSWHAMVLARCGQDQGNYQGYEDGERNLNVVEFHWSYS